jgi:hypothetical protein
MSSWPLGRKIKGIEIVFVFENPADLVLDDVPDLEAKGKK